MKNIVVTGGSGGAGRVVVQDLVEHGYAVLNVDIAPPVEATAPFLKVDLTDLGQAFEALKNADAVVHLAAIPNSGIITEEQTFKKNIASTYNVFTAATTLKLQRVVSASTAQTLGMPFRRVQPAQVPIDESHFPIAENHYAMSKVIGEQMAYQFSRWSGIPFVSLRFTSILKPPDYPEFTGYDPSVLAWTFWSYVDARDAAQSCRLGLTAEIQGAEAFIITATDTLMHQTNAELLALAFPNTTLKPGTGDHDTFFSIEKARKLLGYEPEYTWRKII